MAPRTGFGIVLAALALLGGCGGESTATAAAGTPPTAMAPSTSGSLIGLIAAAPTSVPYDMTRRYESHWGTGLQANSLIYRERAYGDGAGRFAIEPLEVLEPPMSTGKENLFLLVQKVRAGFFFWHRDFAIRDVNRFNQHWQVVDTGVTTQLLGRTCAQLEVQRQKKPDHVYHLTVDIENGLVLRSEERTLEGHTLALLEVESLSLTPSLGGVGFHQPITEVFDLGSTHPASPRLSFVPVQPKLLPKGYQLAQSSIVVEPTLDADVWVRFVYSDGVEELFFLHGGGDEEVNTGGGLGTLGGGAPSGGGVPEDLVKYLEMGSWTVVWGQVKGERFFCMGKLPRGALFDLVESAFY